MRMEVEWAECEAWVACTRGNAEKVLDARHYRCELGSTKGSYFQKYSYSVFPRNNGDEKNLLEILGRFFIGSRMGS